MAQDDKEILGTKVRQAIEIKELLARQAESIQDIQKRKSAKKFQREQQREIKNLYLKTHDQDIAYKKTDEVKQNLREHRERSELLVSHIEERHQKQIKQFAAAEERKINDQRTLVELECRHLNEEQKSEAMKEFQSKCSHQKALDKKKLDQIREHQRVELRHFKDKVDSETVYSL